MDNYVCDGQIDIFDYFKDKNTQHASKCRHATGTFCHIKNKSLKEDIICPCDDYEEKGSCEGCNHNHKNKYDTKCFTCKRYNFLPNIHTKGLNDNYDTK